jgi:sulfatase modifying factor 1
MDRWSTFRSCLVTTLFVIGCKGGSGGEGQEGSFDDGTGLGMGECAGVCGTLGCGTCPQATMIDGGGFQIDATEVDNAQYAMMLEVEFDAEILPVGCEWKSGFEPEGWSDELDPNLPVVGVDWCDAAVFCAWAGKRLCGAVGGGKASWDEPEDGDGDMWYRACTNAGMLPYPYGTSYDPGSCNGGDAGHDALLAVGSLASCEGGVAGLYDMSGNVWEWTDACAADGGDAGTECRRRGGSRYSDADNLRCGVDSARARGVRDNAVGFRCCSD